MAAAYIPPQMRKQMKAVSSASMEPQRPPAFYNGKVVTLVPVSTKNFDPDNQIKMSGIKEGQSFQVLCYLAGSKARYTLLPKYRVELPQDARPYILDLRHTIKSTEDFIETLLKNEYWQVFDETEIQKKLEKENKAAEAQQRTPSTDTFHSQLHSYFKTETNKIYCGYELTPSSEEIKAKTYPNLRHTVATAAANGGHPNQQDDMTISTTSHQTEEGCQIDHDLIAVFDGHGSEGELSSRYAARFLSASIMRQLNDFHQQLTPLVAERAALKSGFVNLRHGFGNCLENKPGPAKDQKPGIKSKLAPGSSHTLQSGTTACALLIKDVQILAANAGDSRALIVDPTGTVTQLTEDATAEDKRYQPSIRKRGGAIEPGNSRSDRSDRIGGCLTPARGLGDLDIIGMSGRPKITSFDMKNDRANHTIVLATDGVFDIATTNQIGDIAHHLRNEGYAPDGIAKTIITLCLNAATACFNQYNKSYEDTYELKDVADNMLVTVIFPHQQSEPTQGPVQEPGKTSIAEQ